MSRHRKRPAPRHQAPSRRSRSEATPARARHFGPAVRRVLVTPTFAAGLGIVLAAVLAYPMTRTVISYGGTPPAGGQPCRVKGCVSGSPGDGGLATASPGRQLATPSPALKDPDLPASSAPGASGAPAWSTVTHPTTTTINQLLYSSAANVISGLATAKIALLRRVTQRFSYGEAR